MTFHDSVIKVERGEDYDSISFELKIPAGEGSHWLDHFISFMAWFFEHIDVPAVMVDGSKELPTEPPSPDVPVIPKPKLRRFH